MKYPVIGLDGHFTCFCTDELLPCLDWVNEIQETDTRWKTMQRRRFPRSSGRRLILGQDPVAASPISLFLNMMPVASEDITILEWKWTWKNLCVIITFKPLISSTTNNWQTQMCCRRRRRSDGFFLSLVDDAYFSCGPKKTSLINIEH